jgi:hypothetical protein
VGNWKSIFIVLYLYLLGEYCLFIRSEDQRGPECITELLAAYRYRLPQFLSLIFFTGEKFRNDVLFLCWWNEGFGAGNWEC